MGTRIVTYQSPNGATISLTREDVATLRLLGVWPRDAKGAEYCTVSHGERYGWQSAEDAAKVRETVGGARNMHRAEAAIRKATDGEGGGV